MVLGATGKICLFAPLGAIGPRFSSSESHEINIRSNFLFEFL